MGLDELAGFYDSYERDVLNEFYIPFFKSAKLVYRVSCYFSAGALASYSKGLEEFARSRGTAYKLIVSEDIDQELFDAIKRGEQTLESLDPLLLGRLREDISFEQRDALELLVDLVSAGVVEIKIALVRRGLFHYKLAYAEGWEGERMVMIGSNNETAASIEQNYECFEFMPYNDSSNHKDNFEAMWNDLKPGMIVKSPSEMVWKELKGFSRKGHVVLEEKNRTTDCLFLDLE